MRIVAGKHRGRRIAAPPGDAVRPTSERARQALFNILAHGRFAPAPVFEDARVLDVFAGTGAFGLEALSRGARFATFIEKDRDAREALAANIKTPGEAARASSPSTQRRRRAPTALTAWCSSTLPTAAASPRRR
jgi:16S rRNA (guanine966-N2)-methyltransferase